MFCRSIARSSAFCCFPCAASLSLSPDCVHTVTIAAECRCRQEQQAKPKEKGKIAGRRQRKRPMIRVVQQSRTHADLCSARRRASCLSVYHTRSPAFPCASSCTQSAFAFFLSRDSTTAVMKAAQSLCSSLSAEPVTQSLCVFSSPQTQCVSESRSVRVREGERGKSRARPDQPGLASALIESSSPCLPSSAFPWPRSSALLSLPLCYTDSKSTVTSTATDARAPVKERERERKEARENGGRRAERRERSRQTGRRAPDTGERGTTTRSTHTHTHAAEEAVASEGDQRQQRNRVRVRAKPESCLLMPSRRLR